LSRRFGPSLEEGAEEQLLEEPNGAMEREAWISGDLRVSGHLRRSSAMMGQLSVGGGAVAEHRRCTRAR